MLRILNGLDGYSLRQNRIERRKYSVSEIAERGIEILQRRLAIRDRPGFPLSLGCNRYFMRI